MVKQSGFVRFGFLALFVLSAVSVVVADFLFYDHVVGWTLGGFVAWFLLLILLRHGRAILWGERRVWGWALTLMSVGLCVSLMLQPGVLAWLLALIALGSLAMLTRGGWPSAGLGWRWLGSLFVMWFKAMARPVFDSRIAHRWSHRTATLRRHVALAVRLMWGVVGIVVPALLSLVFIGLFALANPVVAEWLGTATDRFRDFVINVTDYVTFGRIMLWYLAGVACWGLLRHRPKRQPRRKLLAPNVSYQQRVPQDSAEHPVSLAAQQKRDSQQGDANPITQSEKLNEPDAAPLAWLAGRFQSLIVRCLLAMNAVFAVQLVLDSRFLVLGEALPEGMSYAEYAHRGAYPLIATAILAAAMVLAVFRPGGVAQRSVWARRLVLLWIVQNVLLVGSAVWRLGAYVQIYTLTRLRVAAAVWMLMVAGCLFLMLWRIARSRDNAWLTGWAMGWGLCVLFVCSFVPFDPMIARYNVNNCQELGGGAGPIDVSYLEHLGPDALPAVTHLIENLPPKYANAPQGEVDANGELLLVSRGDDADWKRYESRDAGRYAHPPAANSSRANLGNRVEAVHLRLSGELDADLKDWRGWTARRAWLKHSSAN